MEDTVILLPVYNDWSSLQTLVLQIRQFIPDRVMQILVVNDGSTQDPPQSFDTDIPVHILNLTHNLGHQKAIAIGLSYVYQNLQTPRVLVMDADGNDKVTDAALLLNESDKYPNVITMVKRVKRNETLSFRVIYFFYLTFFRLLTGKNIRYGNFCLIPHEQLNKIAYLNDLWLHLPATIIKSNIPLREIRANKGNRIEGKSKMNSHRFFIHGLGAIAVFIDVIAIRVLIASGIAISISLAALLVVVAIKLTTSFAIPGWASSVGSSLIIIILLSFLIGIFLIFIYLLSQSSRKFIPALHYKDYLIKSSQPV